MERSEEAAAQQWRSRFLRLQVVCRVLAAIGALAAAVLFGLNKQTSVVAGFAIEASYDSSSAFKFFVIGNGMVGGYLVASLPFAANLADGVLLNLLDLVGAFSYCYAMVNMALLMPAVSAATAISFVGKFGNDKTGWAKVCPYYERFCRRGEIAVACSYVAFLIFLFACALSAVYRNRLTLHRR